MSLKSQIESILFISNYPLSYKRIGEILGQKDEKQIQNTVHELAQDYKNRVDSGIMFLQSAQKVQLVTSPEHARAVQKFIQEEMSGELTRASLETLTIVAYRGPVTRSELEKIRGVNCAIILRNLSMRGLIEASFDKKKMETVYQVTVDFLKYLGIIQVSELPDYEKLNSSENLQKILQENKEEL